MRHRRMDTGTAFRGRRMPVAVLLPAVLLAAYGCESSQRQARQESTERWNRVRAQVKVKLATDQLAAGHIEDAASELAAAAQLDPANPELLTLQARVCLARGDHTSAQRVLQGATAEGPQRAEIEYLHGIIQQQRLRWDRAREHFVRAAAANPREVAYIVAIVEAMLQVGEADEARAYLELQEESFGWTAAYHAALAECCEQLEDWSAAAAAWEKVADSEDDTEVRERLGLALYRCQRWSEALTLLRQSLDDAATDSPTHLRLVLGECLLEAGQPAEAQEQFSAVLRGQPRNVAALRLLARTFAQQGSFERARRTAERILAVAPEDPGGMELAAALAFRAGDEDRALLLARKIDQLVPGSGNVVADEIIARLAVTQGIPAK